MMIIIIIVRVATNTVRLQLVHWTGDLQRPNNAGGMAALNSHCKPLTQDGSWSWLLKAGVQSPRPVPRRVDLKRRMTRWQLEWSQRPQKCSDISEVSSVLLNCCWIGLPAVSLHIRLCVYVLGQVMSQARQRLLFHGIWVASSVSCHCDQRASVALELHMHRRR